MDWFLVYNTEYITNPHNRSSSLLPLFLRDYLHAVVRDPAGCRLAMHHAHIVTVTLESDLKYFRVKTRFFFGPRSPQYTREDEIADLDFGV